MKRSSPFSLKNLGNCPAVLGWFLGFFILATILGGRVWALDPNSPIFADKGQDTGSVSQGAPLSLPEEAPSPSPGIFSTFLRLVVALAITLVLVVATIWALRWVWEKRGLGPGMDEDKPVKVLYTTFLGPRKTLQLLEIGSRILVVGVGQDEIHCLDVITDEREIASIKGGAATGFPKVLDRVLQKKESAEQGDQARKLFQESHQAVGEYVEKLRKMKRKRSDDETTRSS